MQRVIYGIFWSALTSVIERLGGAHIKSGKASAGLVARPLFPSASASRDPQFQTADVTASANALDEQLRWAEDHLDRITREGTDIDIETVAHQRLMIEALRHDIRMMRRRRTAPSNAKL